MATLIIRKYQNTTTGSKAEGKWYGRLVHQDTLSTGDLCKHIAKHGTTFTSDVVKGVVEKFVNCFEELLLEGYKVKLDGLGTFYISLSTQGAETAEEFTAKMMTQKATFRTLDDLQGTGKEEEGDDMP